MADRRIRCVTKNENGTLAAVGHSGEWWSPKPVADVVSDIDLGLHTYYVEETGVRTRVQTKGTAPNKYIETTADRTDKNNLLNLGKC